MILPRIPAVAGFHSNIGRPPFTSVLMTHGNGRRVEILQYTSFMTNIGFSIFDAGIELSGVVVEIAVHGICRE